MHILWFQHETLKASRKSLVKTFSAKLAMQYYSPTLNFNNAPAFSLFIKASVSYAGETLSTKYSTSSACETESFGIEAVSTFQRSSLICTSHIGLFRSQHRLIRSSTLFLFLFCIFRACLSMQFCTYLLQILADDYKLSFLVTCI